MSKLPHLGVLPTQDELITDIAMHLQNVNIERSYDEARLIIEAIFDRIVHVVIQEERPVRIRAVGVFYPRYNKNGMAREKMKNIGSELSMPSITLGFSRATQGVKTGNMRTKKEVKERL